VPEGAPFAARRILVAIDASAASLDALEAAVSVAERLGSELTGLFVEDEDLLRLAALPFADIVRSPGGARERIDPTSVEAVLRAVAASARAALEKAASRRGVTWRFRISRGRVAREVLAAAEGADLVVLGASGLGRSGRGIVGATARAAAAGARASVLLLARGARLGGEVVGVDDGTTCGARAVSAAAALVAMGGAVSVLKTTEGFAAGLVDGILRVHPALVVLPAGALAGWEGAAEPLLAVGIAVLLVR
jgi:nucleotide-binding universal stress UspA family protein